MKLTKTEIEVIEQSVINGNSLTLPGTLDRATYVKINKALESIGLKWNRSKKCHTADHDVEDLIDSIINTGEWIDEKKVNQFYETPPEVIEKMLDLANLKEGDIVLEPSSGTGAILKAIQKSGISVKMAYCEINPDRAKECFGLGDFICPNFLDVTYSDIGESLTHIIMNPPFSRQQDISHVLHAIELMTSGAVLVAVMSESVWWRSNKKTLDFWSLVNMECTDAKQLEIEAGAFKKSGTMVKTRILCVTKR